MRVTRVRINSMGEINKCLTMKRFSNREEAFQFNFVDCNTFPWPLEHAQQKLEGQESSQRNAFAPVSCVEG